jgi:hypothetical protein
MCKQSTCFICSNLERKGYVISFSSGMGIKKYSFVLLLGLFICAMGITHIHFHGIEIHMPSASASLGWKTSVT